VAYKQLDARDGGNSNRLGLYIDWHCCQIIAISSDCVSIGIVLKLIAISSDRVSMNILSNRLQSARIMYRWMSTVVSTVGFMVDLTVGSKVDFTWLCWTIDLSKAFD
jgi:hypothetical protein